MSIRLSVAAIERLKPDPNKRREIADAGKPGLYLVIQPSGRKSWAVRYRLKDKPRKLTLDGFPSLSTARELAQEALDAVAKGEDPARAKKAARNAPSSQIEDVFADFMARHLKRRDGRPIRMSTRLETARLLGLKLDASDAWVPRSPRCGALARWSGRDVRTISRTDVQNFLDARVADGAPVGANRTLAALKTAFSWCVKRGLLDASPCDHIDAPSPENSRERELTDTELLALWRATAKDDAYSHMVRLLLLTGQRRDEVREAPWGEFDLAKRVWRLPAARTKNGHEHHVPLSDAAIAVLASVRKIRSRAGWIFTTDGEVPVSNLARRKRRLDAAMLHELRKADSNAELVPWVLHHLRHTLKTWMQAARIPKDVRNAVQNHFDGDMDEEYGHYSFEKEKREALDAWAKHVEAITAPNVVPIRRAIA